MTEAEIALLFSVASLLMNVFTIGLFIIRMNR